jgi:hypothetical protein
MLFPLSPDDHPDRSSPREDGYGLGARRAAIPGSAAAFQPPRSHLLATSKHSYLETLLTNNALASKEWENAKVSRAVEKLFIPTGSETFPYFPRSTRPFGTASPSERFSSVPKNQ